MPKLVKKRKGVIRFVLAPHVTRKDIQRVNLKEHLAKVKRFYMESPYAEEERAEARQAIEKILKGELKEEEIGGDVSHEVVKHLINRKDMEVMLEPAVSAKHFAKYSEHPVLKGFTEKMIVEETAATAFLTGNFKEYLEYRKKGLDLEIEEVRVRDERIAQDLKKRYLEKPNEDIVAFFGSGHKSIVYKLKEMGIPTKMISKKFVEIDPGMRYIRAKLTRFPEERLKSKKWLIAASLPSLIVRDYFIEHHKIDTITAEKKCMKLMKRMSLEDLENLSKFLGDRNRKAPFLDRSEAADFLIHWMKKQGKVKEGEL